MKNRPPYWDIKRNILFDHLERYKDFPSRAIGRILHRDYPDFFAGDEPARSLVRKYRGKHGKQNKDNCKVTKYYQNV
jgi:hypothetical protein